MKHVTHSLLQDELDEDKTRVEIEKGSDEVDVPRRSATCKNPRNEKPSHSTKHVTDSLLQDELDEDTTCEEITDDVTNLLAFK